MIQSSFGEMRLTWAFQETQKLQLICRGLDFWGSKRLAEVFRDVPVGLIESHVFLEAFERFSGLGGMSGGFRSVS